MVAERAAPKTRFPGREKLGNPPPPAVRDQGEQFVSGQRKPCPGPTLTPAPSYKYKVCKYTRLLVANTAQLCQDGSAVDSSHPRVPRRATGLGPPGPLLPRHSG